MKKAFAVTGVFLLGCLGGLLCHLSQEGIVVELTPEQIQEKLDSKFPISKRYLLVLNLTLADPRVALTEGSDRVGFGITATTNVRVNENDLTGDAYVTSRIRYYPEEGSLRLVDPRVEEFTISLLPPEYEDEVLAAADLATQEILTDYELYRLDQADFKQRIAKLVIRDVVVQGGRLRITLGPKEQLPDNTEPTGGEGD
jgi:hypothetical protein